jgi:hypothetical protein
MIQLHMLLVTQVKSMRTQQGILNQALISKKAMLEFERRLEKQNEDFSHKYFESTSKRMITYGSSAMSMKKEVLPINTVSKVKIDSVVSKGSATKTEQHNILSESITYQETSLATEKHEKRKNIARLDFS